MNDDCGHGHGIPSFTTYAPQARATNAVVMVINTGNGDDNGD